MGKIWVEVCLISASGLQRSSSLWKLQRYAVGWIDPNNKYCTMIDTSGNVNPVWKTKFAACIDDSVSKFNDLALHVEVYSREPIFLRDKLQGTTTIMLKEFVAKHKHDPGASRSVIEEVGSYQLRKSNSNKPQGFIDVSVRISEDRDKPNSLGNEGGVMDNSKTANNITLATRNRSARDYPSQKPMATFHRPQNQTQANSEPDDPVPCSTSYSNPSKAGPSYPRPPANGPSYCSPQTPPPPPAPFNVGYTPTFLPKPETYVNMAPSCPARGHSGQQPGFVVGVGAGALAAGAVIFGDDFLSGFDVPSGFHDTNVVPMDASF